ncbi:MAG: NAD(P)H-hydrate dehydratase [Spirochaetota bacterium]
MKVSTVEEMRKLDKGAVETYGIPDLLLMENAGLAVCRVISDRFTVPGGHFIVVCGGGNNGGDGFVVARKLHSQGAAVAVFLYGNPDKLSGSAKTNYDILHKLPVGIDYSKNSRRLAGDIERCEAVIDAVFGTGISRDVEGDYAEAVDTINAGRRPVVSVDIPSGINGDTGAVMGTAVKADMTVTFGLPKLGNILYPGASYCGELFVSHISFPREHYTGNSPDYEINPVPVLPPRRPEGHKGSFGEVLVVAGAASYYGAPALCAGSFLRAGGGYSRLAAVERVIRSIAGANPEIVYMPQPATPAGSIDPSCADELVNTAGAADFVVVGPGIGREEGTEELVLELVRRIEKPLLLDGDGLYAVGSRADIVSGRKAPTFLTPHPGEMGGLLGRAVSEVLTDPAGAVREAAERFGAVVALKGARTMIGSGKRGIAINLTGNSGMGTAGSGDVLSGIVPAMYCHGLDPENALRAGVFVHGLAGDLAAECLGEDGLTAFDIMRHVPEAMKKVRSGFCGSEMIRTV